MTQHVHRLTTLVEHTLAGLAATPLAKRELVRGHGPLFYALCYDPPCIRRAFGEVNLPENLRHTRPPIALQGQAQLSGIGCLYELPPGLSPARLEAFTRGLDAAAAAKSIEETEAHHLLQELLDDITRRNPALEQLSSYTTGTKGKVTALLGVCRGLNVSDIRFALTGPRSLFEAMRNSKYSEHFNRACTLINTQTLGWMPALCTLRSIIFQAERHTRTLGRG